MLRQMVLRAMPARLEGTAISILASSKAKRREVLRCFRALLLKDAYRKCARVWDGPVPVNVLLLSYASGHNTVRATPRLFIATTCQTNHAGDS